MTTLRARTLLLSAAVLIGGLGVGCSDDGDKAVDTGTTDESADGSTTTGPAAEPVEGDQDISIADYAFDPDGITVKAGTKVTWTNTDSFPHTATSDDGAPAAFDVDQLGTDDSGEFTFKEAGSYGYHCNIHDYMKGTVDVVE